MTQTGTTAKPPADPATAQAGAASITTRASEGARKRLAKRPAKPVSAIFFAPAVIAVVTTAGLVSALLGDGVWDAASWLGLSVPIVVAGWYIWVRQPQRR